MDGYERSNRAEARYYGAAAARAIADCLQFAREAQAWQELGADDRAADWRARADRAAAIAYRSARAAVRQLSRS